MYPTSSSLIVNEELCRGARTKMAMWTVALIGISRLYQVFEYSSGVQTLGCVPGE